MQFNIDNENQTRDLAEKLAPILKCGDVVFLIGDLGAGKTTFARHLIQHLVRKQENVPSPTFTLVQTYDFEKNVPLHHYDLYRLPETEAEDEIIELGWDDSLSDAITLVEWPDRLGDLTPATRLEIKIKRIDEHKRKITIIPFGNWDDRLDNLA